MAALVFTVFVSSLARAEPSTEPTLVRLAYVVPDGCPDATTFVAVVRARVPRLRLAVAKDRARDLRITIGWERSSFRGLLALQSPSGAVASRDVSGTTCDEVVAALALVTSLALESEPVEAVSRPSASIAGAGDQGTADRASSAASATEAASATVAGSPATAPQGAPTRSAGATAPSTRDARDTAVVVGATADSTREASNPRAQSSVSGTAATWQVGVGVGAAVAGGLAPVPFPAGAAFVDVARDGAGVVLAPSLRVGVEVGSTTTLVRPPGTVRFRSVLAVLSGCPLRWSTGDLHVGPCARIELGSLEGASGNITPSRSVASVWLALGTVVQARYRIAGPLFVTADLGLRAPLTRPRFFFQPDVTVHRAPFVGTVADAGMGVTFL